MHAERHGLNLDESTTLRDLGISAFRGANRETGALAVFLEAVECGRIAHGSYLLLESLDRLSRDEVAEALPPFMKIIKAGITIVTLADEHVYNRETIRDGMQLMFSLLIMIRAHEESATKADRLAKAWERKRRDAGTSKVTAKCPAWLELQPDRKSFKPIPERVNIINRMYREFVNGIGRGTIAVRLNKDGIPPFGHGREWHGGTVQKYIGNPALIGRYQPHTVFREYVKGPDGKAMLKEQRVPAGEVIPDYYPAVISEKLFLQAEAVAKERSVRPGNAGGRRGTVYSNLFSGMCRCTRCGGRMIYKDPGRRGTSVLRCSRNRNGNCTNDHRFKYLELENAILDRLESFDWTDEVPHEVQEYQARLAEQTMVQRDLQAKIDRLEDAVENGEPVGERLKKRHAEIQEVKIAIAGLEHNLAVAMGKPQPKERVSAISKLRKAMTTTEGAERYAVRAELAQIIRDIAPRDAIKNAYIAFTPFGTVEYIVAGFALTFTKEGVPLPY